MKNYHCKFIKLFSADVKWLSFAGKLLLCRLKTLILLNFLTVQLFARYSKLTTYMSVAPISLDILV